MKRFDYVLFLGAACFLLSIYAFWLDHQAHQALETGQHLARDRFGLSVSLFWIAASMFGVASRFKELERRLEAIDR